MGVQTAILWEFAVCIVVLVLIPLSYSFSQYVLIFETNQLAGRLKGAQNLQCTLHSRPGTPSCYTLELKHDKHARRCSCTVSIKNADPDSEVHPYFDKVFAEVHIGGNYPVDMTPKQWCELALKGVWPNIFISLDGDASTHAFGDDQDHDHWACSTTSCVQESTYADAGGASCCPSTLFDGLDGSCSIGLDGQVRLGTIEALEDSIQKKLRAERLHCRVAGIVALVGAACSFTYLALALRRASNVEECSPMSILSPWSETSEQPDAGLLRPLRHQLLPITTTTSLSTVRYSYAARPDQMIQ